jgi:glycosyltransferase involved in cell wall biosynthesis
MPFFYNSSDVFVLPSFYEGMPLTVLEAMACGLPVVAFRVGGLPDCVFDDINGYLVEPGNIKELIEKIKLAYENRERLGKNGRILVEKIFNWNYVVDRYIELYEKVARR